MDVDDLVDRESESANPTDYRTTTEELMALIAESAPAWVYNDACDIAGRFCNRNFRTDGIIARDEDGRVCCPYDIVMDQHGAQLAIVSIDEPDVATVVDAEGYYREIDTKFLTHLD